mmetsp:Transcript_57239/g.125243  ORF Transcript_57239/g.125243 Transcript_57239/m.125243 type:complete len:239 (-) Transcript_57239:1369-2085(-)
MKSWMPTPVLSPSMKHLSKSLMNFTKLKTCSEGPHLPWATMIAGEAVWPAVPQCQIVQRFTLASFKMLAPELHWLSLPFQRHLRELELCLLVKMRVEARRLQVQKEAHRCQCQFLATGRTMILERRRHQRFKLEPPALAEAPSWDSASPAQELQWAIRLPCSTAPGQQLRSGGAPVKVQDNACLPELQELQAMPMVALYSQCMKRMTSSHRRNCAWNSGASGISWIQVMSTGSFNACT